MAVAMLHCLSHQKDQAVMNSPLKNGEIGVMKQKKPTEGVTASTRVTVKMITLGMTDAMMITNMTGMMKVERS